MDLIPNRIINFKPARDFRVAVTYTFRTVGKRGLLIGTVRGYRDGTWSVTVDHRTVHANTKTAAMSQLELPAEYEVTIVTESKRKGGWPKTITQVVSPAVEAVA